MYNTNSDVKVKTTMLKSSWCDFSDACILAIAIITINGAGVDADTRHADEKNKGIIFKNCVPFINCKSEINNTEIDNAKDIDIVMRMYKLTEYSDSYSEKHLEVYGNITRWTKW